HQAEQQGRGHALELRANVLVQAPAVVGPGNRDGPGREITGRATPLAAAAAGRLRALRAAPLVAAAGWPPSGTGPDCSHHSKNAADQEPSTIAAAPGPRPNLPGRHRAPTDLSDPPRSPQAPPTLRGCQRPPGSARTPPTLRAAAGPRPNHPDPANPRGLRGRGFQGVGKQLRNRVIEWGATWFPTNRHPAKPAPAKGGAAHARRN